MNFSEGAPFQRTLIQRWFPRSKKTWFFFTLICGFTMLQVLITNLNAIVDSVMIGRMYSLGDRLVDFSGSGNFVLDTEELVQSANQGSLAGLSHSGWWWFIVYSVPSFITLAVGFNAVNYYIKRDLTSYRRAASVKISAISIYVLLVIIIAMSMQNTAITLYARKDYRPASAYDLSDYNQKLSYLKNSFEVDSGTFYLRFIIFSWIIWSGSLIATSILREIGKPYVPLVSVCCSLLCNIVLNYLLVYVARLNIVGLLISTTISNLLEVTISWVYLAWKKRELIPSFYDFFNKVRAQWKALWQRSFFVIFGAAWTLLTIVRPIILNSSFQEGGHSYNLLVGSVAVLSIAGVFQNVFLPLADGTSPLIHTYLAQKMQRGPKDRVIISSQKIVVFAIILAIIISGLIMLIAFLTPLMKPIFDVSPAVLVQARAATLVIAAAFPAWIVNNTIRNIMSQGSRTRLISILELGSMAFQASALVALGVAQRYGSAFDRFWVPFAIFNATEYVKLVVFVGAWRMSKWWHHQTDTPVLEGSVPDVIASEAAKG